MGSANFVQATGHCLLVANLLRDGERAGVVLDGLVIFPEALVGVAEVVQAADCTSEVATLTSSVNSSQDVLRLIDEGTTCRRLVVDTVTVWSSWGLRATGPDPNGLPLEARAMLRLSSCKPNHG